MRSKFALAGLVLLLAALVLPVFARQPRVRTTINIPDIGEFKTLKCDFHTHTVFSDGKVWPDIRAEEAWREGLDVIAITDHIEYQPHKEDLPTSHNRSFEIAKAQGDQLQVTVIRGSEITRRMPPGHLNAIFLNASDTLEVDEWRDAVKEAHEQGAFIFWNHPGWTGQQPDGVARWYPEHTELLEKGWLHGIEVVNDGNYYPEAHQWCIEHNLTMLSNSDVHNPLNLDYDATPQGRRPLTLVFATDESPEAVKEALFARRTAVYYNNSLVGDERFLRPIFDRSVEVKNPSVTLTGTAGAHVQIRNTSDIDYQLDRDAAFNAIQAPKSLTLRAGKTVLVQLRSESKDRSGQERISIPYTVRNLKVAPRKGMPFLLDLDVTFVPGR
jgi:3',5'-nucleoside bisphosphate phosphatase